MTRNAKIILPTSITVAVLVGLTSLLMAADPAEKTSDAKVEQQVVEDSMHEFMEYVYQPTYKRLKTSMKAEPADRNGWKAIKADSLILAESANRL